MIIHLILISVTITMTILLSTILILILMTTISKAKLVKLLILVIIMAKMVKLLVILKSMLVIKLLQYSLLRLLIITTVAMRVKVAIKDNLLLIIKAVKVATKTKLQLHKIQLLLYNHQDNNLPSLLSLLNLQLQ